MYILLHDPSVCVFMYGQATESRWVNSQKMKLKYNSGTQYVPLDHIETVRYHIPILFTIYLIHYVKFHKWTS